MLPEVAQHSFWQRVFWKNCLEHWTPIHLVVEASHQIIVCSCYRTSRVHQTALAVSSACRQDWGLKPWKPHQHQLKISKGALHYFLRGLGQWPVTCLPYLMLNGKMKEPVNGHSSDIKCYQFSAHSNNRWQVTCWPKFGWSDSPTHEWGRIFQFLHHHLQTFWGVWSHNCTPRIHVSADEAGVSSLFHPPNSKCPPLPKFSKIIMQNTRFKDSTCWIKICQQKPNLQDHDFYRICPQISNGMISMEHAPKVPYMTKSPSL